MSKNHPISDRLIIWYAKHKRDLPWRDINDPYKIWLSEIILQQTQVIQGLDYYLKFIQTFPNVSALANASEDRVLKLWQGLGYYSRARNLHEAAKSIVKNHKGVFPNSYESIKQLKGVGDYTAAAISSFAFKLPYAVVDGNVYRVLSRLFNIHTPINSSKGKKEFQLLANELLNKKKPDAHNSALMEFGALWCKPKNPKCEECPLNTYCLAYEKNTTTALPIKDKKIKIKTRYFHYFIFNYKNKIYLQKRILKDIWQNLYEFYLIETEKELDVTNLLNNKTINSIAGNFELLSITNQKKHILSHQHIYANFYEIKVKKPIKSNSLIEINREEIINYSLPQMIIKYLKTTKAK